MTAILCPECGAAVAPVARGPGKAFCSDAHRLAFNGVRGMGVPSAVATVAAWMQVKARTRERRPPPTPTLTATVERARKDLIGENAAVGDDGRPSRRKVQRVQTRVAAMAAAWQISERRQAALAAYEMLTERCHYGGGRCTLDREVHGDADHGAADRIVTRRSALAKVRNSVVAATDGTGAALMLVDALLWPAGVWAHENLTQSVRRLVCGPRAVAMRSAASSVRRVCDALIVPMRVG